MKVQSIIDTCQSHHKPTTDDLGHVSQIKSRLKNGKIKEQTISINELANKLINGYAVIPAILQGGASDDNFISQQVFMVDIDNKDKILTKDDALRICGDVKPSFIYATFSYSDEVPKYRVVFILDKVITSKEQRDYIQKYFIDLFDNYADKSCIDSSRVFYGGKKLLYSNYENIVNSDDILKDYNLASKKIINDIKDISILDYIMEMYPNSKVKRSVAIKMLEDKYNIESENSTKFKHNIFANSLIEKYHIVKYDNCLYIYYDNYYHLERKDDSILEKIMINEFEEITLHQRKEVYSYIERIAPHKDLAPCNYIPFKNCILNIDTMEKLAYTPDLLIRYIIPHNFVEFKDDNKVVEKIMLDFVNGDKESKPILYEMIGYCLYNDNPFSSLFFLYGNGASGKTTYLNALINIVGKDNCSYSMISDLGERFGTSVLIGKVVNIGDDCKKAFIDDLGTIKQITGDSTIEVEFKGQSKFNYKTYIKLLFSFNKLPKLGESGNQINRRIILIPFFNKFRIDPKSKVKKILESEEVAEYLIYKGVISLKELLKREGFTTSKLLEVEKAKYLNFLNPTEQFIKENTSSFNNPSVLCEDTYLNYLNWCSDNCYDAESHNMFGRKVREYYKPKQLKNGKRYYIPK